MNKHLIMNSSNNKMLNNNSKKKNKVLKYKIKIKNQIIYL